jgi:hypothetical protein
MMHVNTALKIIKENYQIKKGSFIHYLHELSYFSLDSFNKYLLAIETLICCKSIDNQTIYMIMFTHKNILRSFIWHLDCSDSSSLKEFPTSNFNDLTTDLNATIESFLNSALIKQDRIT